MVLDNPPWPRNLLVRNLCKSTVQTPLALARSARRSPVCAARATQGWLQDSAAATQSLHTVEGSQLGHNPEPGWQSPYAVLLQGVAARHESLRSRMKQSCAAELS